MVPATQGTNFSRLPTSQSLSIHKPESNPIPTAPNERPGRSELYTLHFKDLLRVRSFNVLADVQYKCYLHVFIKLVIVEPLF